MKRDVLDYQGIKIGELELPDNTPEEVWVARLAEFAQAPISPEIADVTPRQFRQALVLSGIAVGTIEALINSQPDPIKSLAMIEWEYSIAFKRNNQFVNQLAPALGFTSQRLDDLWRLAATL